MSLSVEVRKNDFPRIASRFGPAAKEIDQLAVFKTVEFADPITPVDTGFLKNAKEIGPDSVHWLADYAGHVNFGTVHQAAQPFATTAVDHVRPQWVQAHAHIEGKL